MGDDKLPRIPSFAELGISEDEIEELEREIAEAAAERRERETGKGAGAGPGAARTGTEAGSGAAAGRGAARGPGAAAPGTASSGAASPGSPAADPAAATGPGADTSSPRGPGKAPAEAQRKRATKKPKRKPARPKGKSGWRAKRAEKQASRKRAAADAAAARDSAAAATRPAPTTPPPWGGLRGPATLLLLLVTAWLSSSYRSIPSPVAATASDSVFSSARAMSHLARIASEARPPGSPNHARTRDYLIDRLGALGHTASVQTTTSFDAGTGGPITVATVRNILARVPGTEPGGPAVLVTAHYDSREIALGAADDGAGVVAILEAVRALGARAPLRNDLIVLITDAEEIGLLGARAFVDEHPWFDDVAVLIAIEMRGGGGPSMMFETGANNGWVIDALRQADPYPSANSVSYEIYQRMPNDTDFTPFKEAGKQGLNFAAIGKAHVYHQYYDSPENLSEGTLQHHGEHVLAMLEHFGNADLSNVDAPDVSYLSVPFAGLVTYGPLWIRVLGGAAVAGWLLALVVGRKGGARFVGMLVGLGASAVYLGLVSVLANALYNWREGAHPELGALHAGSFHSEGWYLLAIAGVAFALAAAFAGVLRRWFSVAELAVGALLVPVGLAAAVTIMFPMAAMNFQWPAVAGCVGALAVCGLARGQRMGLARWIVVVAAAVPVIVVLTPLTEGVWLAMGLASSAWLALVPGLGFLMLLPALDAAREPNGWWAPVAGLVAAGAFLAVGMSTATPSPERPAPSTLVYMLDHETGTAYWGTDRYRDASDPGVAWAAAAAGPFAAPDADPPAPFASERLWYTFAPADPADIPPPNVTVADDPNLPGDVLRVSVTSAIGAERMSFTIPEDGPRLAAVNGLLLPAGSELRDRLVHWGAPPEGGLILDFIRPPGDPRLSFTLVEHHLRPGELVGEHYFARPPELAPNTRTRSDRAIIRTRVNIGGAGEAELADVGPSDEEPTDSAGAQWPPVGTFSIYRRGMQSAAMLIVQEDGGVWLNNDVVLRLQVDDHEEPIAELRRLVEIAAARLQRRRSLPERIPAAERTPGYET